MSIKESVKELIAELSELSKLIVWDISLAQGAGGNSSVKDDRHLVIKASGVRLRDLSNKTGYAVIKRRNDQHEIKHLDSVNQVRPSIEWPLHLACPSKFVIHLHALGGLALGLATPINKTTVDGMCLVPYADPGINLLQLLNSLNVWSIPTKSVLLRNHGVLAWGDSIEECINAVTTNEQSATHALGISIEDRISLIETTTYALKDGCLDFSKTLDIDWLKFISNNVLFPDQIVFLGDLDLQARTDTKMRVNLSGLSVAQCEILAFLHLIGCVVRTDMCVSCIPTYTAQQLAQTEAERFRKQVR